MSFASHTIRNRLRELGSAVLKAAAAHSNQLDKRRMAMEAEQRKLEEVNSKMTGEMSPVSYENIAFELEGKAREHSETR